MMPSPPAVRNSVESDDDSDAFSQAEDNSSDSYKQDNGEENEKTDATKKPVGRKKSGIELIGHRQKRNSTFHKRKIGLMKKGFELGKLTGLEVLVLAVRDDVVFSYGTAKLKRMLQAPIGKELIRQCLNTPLDPSATRSSNDSERDRWGRHQISNESGLTSPAKVSPTLLSFPLAGSQMQPPPQASRVTSLLFPPADIPPQYRPGSSRMATPVGQMSDIIPEPNSLINPSKSPSFPQPLPTPPVVPSPVIRFAHLPPGVDLLHQPIPSSMYFHSNPQRLDGVVLGNHPTPLDGSDGNSADALPYHTEPYPIDSAEISDIILPRLDLASDSSASTIPLSAASGTSSDVFHFNI